MQSGMFERLARVAFIAVLPMPAAAGTVLATTTTVSVHGTIFDSRTRKPVAGSNVIVHDEQGLTQQIVADTHGRYSAVGLAAGNITIAAEKDAFQPETITCRVEPGTSATFDLALQRGGLSIVRSPVHCPIQSQTQDSYAL